MTEELKKNAIEFLREEFDPKFDCDLQLERTFDSHPLREEGLTALFSFQSSGEHYFVFAGNALPMVYPDWNLTSDELWAVHLGMEYFIKMGVADDTERKGPKFLAYLKMVATVFQEQLYITLNEPPKIEKIYVLQDQRHIVGRVAYDGKVYSWIVGDIPHFVYKKDLPPQVIWSLHIGRILLT